MERANCWQVKACGREPGGIHAKSLGTCPAATCRALDGVHGGLCAGRACWAVVGTLCGGSVQGTFAKKSAHCGACTFYEAVKAEEGAGFLLTPLLLRRVREGDADPAVPLARVAG